ncbi:thioredoxin domain-containing protein [Thiolapillus brandeum]|uniref:Spermatogenesis-associated protein 20-like TRX domain-containing protein n=1 Tax=Thiolapillus brandeum TaxID=1076588 RepID=A0A7U6GHB1_9GAMM|nr:DUF255 domain-containing protein [Thiolapillus brandeum]BAO43654.1 conserved hypothetical protein [Thiolapillus brandeum]
MIVWVSAQALENRLADNPSPYLAMHGHDPVAWQEWNAETLDLAKKEGKLLFISSGYFACHWCHVMQRESYSNPVIAELLNKYFIPVKVDRELNPALDEHLIDFVQRTQGRAGWPLNVFLTPEGYPLVGMTYVSPEKFRTLLNRLQKMWQAERPQATRLAKQALEALVATRQGKAGDELISRQELQQKFLESAMDIADDIAGGFGQQNRFPMTPQLSALLEIQARHPEENLAHFLRLTLDQMASRGMRDHLGGGFFRYTMDPGWRRPHYEKMLYTQALLARLYLRAAEVFKEPRYAAVARDTLDFTLREMCAGSACVASFSAVDGGGVEGGYYLWKEAELKQLLKGQLWPLARDHWQLKGFDNNPEGVLPMQGASVEELARAHHLPEAEVRDLLEKARRILLEVRRKRSLPVDSKRLAGWNGLMLGALSQAARQEGQGDYRNAAEGLRRYIVKKLWNGRQLCRAVHQGKPVGQASLADYAYVAEGLRQFALVTGRDEETGLMETLLKSAWRDFHTPKGWISSSSALLPGMPSVPVQEDGALPSASAIVLRLSLLSQDAGLLEEARGLVPASWLAVQDAPFWYATTVSVLLFSRNPPAAAGLSL